MGVNGIYGLSGSGMDIESMVKVGMMAKQNEYDKMAQKYTKNEWIKADFLDLSSQISTFSTSTLSQYKMSTSMNAKLVESTSSAVKATAGSAATLMNHTVDVISLSANAYAVSTTKPTRYTGSSGTSMQLKDILFQNITDNGNGMISGTTGNGKTFNIDTNQHANAIQFTLKDGTKDADGNDNSATISMTYQELIGGATFNDLVSKINSAGLNIRASYDSVYDNFSIFNTKNGKDNTVSIEISSQNISTLTKNVTDTYTQNATKNGLESSYSYDTAQLQSNTVNSQSKVYSDVVGSTTSDFFNSWGLYQTKNGELADTKWAFTWGENETTITNTTKVTNVTYTTHNYSGSDTVTTGTINGGTTTTTDYNTRDTFPPVRTLTGENATIRIDSVTYDKVTDNQVTVNGVTYKAMATGTATVSISQDTDAIIDKVKSFIADYNKLLGNLYAKYDEKPNSDYKPLSQTQKDQMKEEQIEKWEEKAKKGLLYHDQTIGKIIQEMRSAVTQSVEGVDGQYNSVFSLGISTTGIKGQLVLDEDKLKKALAADSDAVYNVFAKLDSADLDNKAKSGVAQRLGDVFVNATKNIKSRAGSSSDITEDSDLNNLLRNLQTRMSNFKKMMTTYENALYKKYDAMETMLTRLGTQLNFVMGSSS